MQLLCDLHTHSVFSDGTYTPEELIDAAVELGLSAVALCDHNTVDGVPRFLAHAKDKPVEAIAGAEFSVDYNGTELHLLGLYIPEDKLQMVSDLMEEVNNRKDESNIALVNSLRDAGYDIDYESIKSKSTARNINRAHVAVELTERGYTASIKEAFDTLLSKTAGFYVEPDRLTVFEVIEALVSIGATPVLAHPFLNLSEEELTVFLPTAKQCGLVSMECFYSLYDQETVEKSLRLAAEFDLLPSGGSDFHGTTKPDIRLGDGRGNLSIAYELAVALKPAPQKP